MSKEELRALKADELAKICKEKGITHYRGKTRYRRDEMIEEILKSETGSTSVETPIQDPIPEPEPAAEENIDTMAKEEKVVNIYQRQGTAKYLENIEVGALVAFKEKPDKLNTAAVQNISFKRRQLKLVTQYEKEFVVSFDDVVWVRTTKRWPKFVMDALKQQSRRRKENAVTGEAAE